MSTSSDRAQACGQLSPVGIAIGVVGCVVITASSVYTALKMGSLPWPTIFTSITALVLLRAFGHRSLNEANITQIVMSAGSMVAGGLAFTIPGIWILGLADYTSMAEMLFVALAGTLLGLVCTALIRRRFVAESNLEYPIGTAAAETLTATTSRGGTGKKLFLSMGIAGVYSVLRDVLGVVPQMLLTLPIPGVTFGIYNSPMMLSVGFLVGFGALAFAMAGAVFANFGLVVGGIAAGLWDVATAGGIVKSLGMGLMMGSGLGVVLKDILPALVRMAQGRDDVHAGSGEGSGTASVGKDSAAAASGERGGLFADLTGRYDAGVLALMVAAAALVICLGLGLSPLVAVVIILLSFVTTIMSAQSVGQTGIDPMEIFGLIVLLIVAVISQTPPREALLRGRHRGRDLRSCGRRHERLQDRCYHRHQPARDVGGPGHRRTSRRGGCRGDDERAVHGLWPERVWRGQGLRGRPGERRGHDGIRHPECARLRDRPCGRHRDVPRGPAEHDVRPRRLPALLHAALDVRGLRGKARVRPLRP